MSKSTFTHKRLDFTFELGLGVFGESGTKVVRVSGLRSHVQIEKAGGPGMGTAMVRIEGMTESLMNQLSALSDGAMAARKNTLIIDAGDEQGMATVFSGQIIAGQIDLNASPDVALLVIAQAGALEAVKPASPTSYPGAADASAILESLASRMNMRFEGPGVPIMLSTPYLTGSLRDQVKSVAEAANLDWVIDDGVLVACTRTGFRAGAIPLVSVETGLIGYPRYTNSVLGVNVTTLFNPLLRIMARVEVQSRLRVACGVWRIFNLKHELESEVPGGKWFTHFDCSVFTNQATAPA